MDGWLMGPPSLGVCVLRSGKVHPWSVISYISHKPRPVCEATRVLRPPSVHRPARAALVPPPVTEGSRLHLTPSMPATCTHHPQTTRTLTPAFTLTVPPAAHQRPACYTPTACVLRGSLECAAGHHQHQHPQAIALPHGSWGAAVPRSRGTDQHPPVREERGGEREGTSCATRPREQLA
eukprot:scaffold98188_cov58-Phaeocystis_antarctica.AAC.2